jgi:hypothetical protein
MSAADPGSKVSPAKEPGDVADVGEDPCGTDRADARDVRGSLRTSATKVCGPGSQPTASPGLLSEVMRPARTSASDRTA